MSVRFCMISRDVCLLYRSFDYTIIKWDTPNTPFLLEKSMTYSAVNKVTSGLLKS